MVRADDQAGRKVKATESSSRRRVAEKEPYVAPLWPCKMNGCGKKFVREADLKRHQRTTKTHSLPNYTCQECDASFTRTDALRRHQKSRHHVVKAVRGSNEGNGESPSGEARTASTSSARSRSASPVQNHKDKELKDRIDRELPPLETTGPSRYYRQHTAMSTPHIPSTPPSRPLTQSSSLNAILASPIPTPRLHAATWTYPAPWQSNPHVGYPQQYTANTQYVPHYRYPPASNMAPPLLAPVHPETSRCRFDRQGDGPREDKTLPEGSNQGSISRGSPTPPPTAPSPPGHGSGSGPTLVPGDLPSSPETETDNHKITDIEACIDPATGITAEEVKAAMAAVLKSVRQERAKQEEAKAGAGASLSTTTTANHDGSPFLSETSSFRVNTQTIPNGHQSPRRGNESSLEGEDIDNIDMDEQGKVKELVRSRKGKANRINELHDYGPPLDESPTTPMEHIINEDGEPMLHPAELLTQESLATP